MNIDPSSIHPLTNSNTNNDSLLDKFPFKWPKVVMSVTKIFPSATLTPNEVLTARKWEELKNKKDYVNALHVLNAHQGQSIYVTALKIETFVHLQSREKITDIYLNNPNDTYDPRTLFIIANSFFAQRVFDKAFECIQKFIALDDTNPHAWLFAGIISRLLNKVELFEDFFQKGISLAQKLNETELEHQCYYSLGIELYHRGKVDQALEQLNKLPDTYSEAASLKAYIYALEKKEDQAVILIEKLLASPIPAQLKNVGDHFTSAEKESPIFFILTYICYVVAEVTLNSEKEDSSAWLTANRQRFLNSLLEFPKALKQLNLLSSIRILLIILSILQKEKNANACVEFLDACIDNKFLERWIVSLRAGLLINAGRIEEAEEAINKLCEPLSKDESHIKMQLCVLRHNDEAAWDFSCETFDGNDTNHYQWADIYLRNTGKHSLEKGNLIYAIAGYLHLNQAIYLGQFKAAQKPALLLKAKKDFHEALNKLIEKPITFASERSFYIFITQIWTFLSREKNDKLALSVLKLLNPILESIPADIKPAYYHRLIHSLCYSEQVEEAYKLLPEISDEKIKELPLFQQASILTIKGAVLFDPKVGELDQAKDCFQRALKIEPQDLCCLDSLSSIHIRKHEYASAIPYLKSLLEIAPANLSTHYELLHCLFYSDQMDEFENTLSVLMPTSYHSDEYLYWTTQLHLKKQNRYKAKEFLEKLLKLEKGLTADTPIGEILKKLKENKKDNEALLIIQTCQEFPEIFTEEKDILHVSYFFNVFVLTTCEKYKL